MQSLSSRATKTGAFLSILLMTHFAVHFVVCYLGVNKQFLQPYVIRLLCRINTGPQELGHDDGYDEHLKFEHTQDQLSYLPVAMMCS